GLQAASVQIQIEAQENETGTHRHLSDIRTILEQSKLKPIIVERSLAVFTRLAEAEAHVHGTVPEKIHFHEVVPWMLSLILSELLLASIFSV
ncbi:hypothetical protein VU01_14601, partial [Candidatus Electrothrix marina]